MSDFEYQVKLAGEALNDLLCSAEAHANGNLIIVLHDNVWRVGLGSPNIPYIGTGQHSRPLKTGATLADTARKIADDPRKATCIISREESILRGEDRLLDSSRPSQWR